MFHQHNYNYSNVNISLLMEQKLAASMLTCSMKKACCINLLNIFFIKQIITVFHFGYPAKYLVFLENTWEGGNPAGWSSCGLSTSHMFSSDYQTLTETAFMVVCESFYKFSKKLIKRGLTWSQDRQCTNKLTQIQLFRENFLEILLAFHREPLFKD